MATRAEGQARPDRGVALVIVIWTLALLAVIALSFTRGTRNQVVLARNVVENAQASALADAGVYRAAAALLSRRAAGRWRADQTPYTLALDGGSVRVSIQYEGGRIDLNTASGPLLRGLFLSVGLDADASEALVDAVADWRDENDLRRLKGAEERDYRAAGLPLGPKNGPFETVEELRQVIGVTPELYRRLVPALTVYSGQPGIDLATAPREALLAIPGVERDEIESFLEARGARGSDAGIDASLAPAGSAPYVSRPRALVYSIRAEARSAGGSVFVREAVVQLTRLPSEPIRFRAWKRYRTPPDEEGGGDT